jgi:hypothetical protein
MIEQLEQGQELDEQQIPKVGKLYKIRRRAPFIPYRCINGNEARWTHYWSNYGFNVEPAGYILCVSEAKMFKLWYGDGVSHDCFDLVVTAGFIVNDRTLDLVMYAESGFTYEVDFAAIMTNARYHMFRYLEPTNKDNYQHV